MTAATKLLAPLDLGQLERDLQAKIQDILELRARLESEIAMRLYFQHKLASRGAYVTPWDLADPAEQQFWRQLAWQEVSNTL